MLSRSTPEYQVQPPHTRHRLQSESLKNSAGTDCFQDKQVSRIQFSLQLFKKFDSSVLSFEIKNMSKKTSLIVDNKELGYLNKIDLPYKCMVRFGDYQFLMEKEEGESLEFFEVLFMMSPRSLLQENNWPAHTPVPEYSSTQEVSSGSTSPIETDENEA